MMAFQLYNCDDDFDFLKVLHKGNIIMTVASVFMVVITVSEIHFRFIIMIIVIIIFI